MARGNHQAGNNWPAGKIRNCSAEIMGPIIEMRSWPKVDKKDPAAVEARINEYFNYCLERGLRPTVEMLAASMRVNVRTIENWQHYGGELADLINDAKATINAILSEMAMNNLVNPTTLIWFQKNHEGYKDNVTLETRPATGLDALPSKEEIAKRLPKARENLIEGEYTEVDEGEDGGEEGNI